MALSKEGLLGKLKELGIAQETIGHALSPTCEVHSENLKGSKFERFVGKGQAKNLFFKVPSGGGKLKNRLFLVCALVETAVDNKLLSARLGIKASAPLRLAGDDVFDKVLQVPKGSVTPFCLANPAADEVTLLLDQKFNACEKLLFHPMQSDFTTALAPDQLRSFLEKVAPTRHIYVDFATDAEIPLPEEGGGSVAPAATEPKKDTKPKAEPKPKAAASTKEEKPKEKKEQMFAPDDMFTIKASWEETAYASAHKAWSEKK